jgi:preprotein translocase subunit SecA
MTEGQEIESRMVTRGIENAQKKVEARNFEIRKNLLEYDEVMDKQRRTIYETRQAILEGEDLKDKVLAMINDTVVGLMGTYLGDTKKDWELDEFAERLNMIFGSEFTAGHFEKKERELVESEVMEGVTRLYEEKEELVGTDEMRRVERFLLLNVLDAKWKDHLYAMDALKAGISLRSYAQVDPKTEYKKEGFEKFRMLLTSVAEDVTSFIFKLRVEREDEERLTGRWSSGETVRQEMSAFDGQRRGMDQAIKSSGKGAASVQIRRKSPKVGRNDPCPCGSGKKYKKCCGARS